MIPFIPNPADKSGGSHHDNHHFQRILPRKNVPPRNTPDSFCRRFTRQNHRCAAWAVFFFSGNLSGQSPSILLCKTVPLLKKPLGLSLLRCACKRKPYLENFMSRPNVIPAFQPTSLQNRGRNFVWVSRRFYIRAAVLYLFLRLNNSEITVRNVF